MVTLLMTVVPFAPERNVPPPELELKVTVVLAVALKVKLLCSNVTVINAEFWLTGRLCEAGLKARLIAFNEAPLTEGVTVAQLLSTRITS
jgi:hypothetical protein